MDQTLSKCHDASVSTLRSNPEKLQCDVCEHECEVGDGVSGNQTVAHDEMSEELKKVFDAAVGAFGTLTEEAKAKVAEAAPELVSALDALKSVIAAEAETV